MSRRRKASALAGSFVAALALPEVAAANVDKVTASQVSGDWHAPPAVLAAAVLPGLPESAPGTVLDDQLSIACGEGVLRPLRLQRAGRAAVESAAFLRGHPIAAGTVLPCPATS